MTRSAPAVLWLALAVQMTWVILNGLILHRAPGLDVFGVVIIATFAAFAAGRRRARWQGRGLSMLVRVLMAAEVVGRRRPLRRSRPAGRGGRLVG